MLNPNNTMCIVKHDGKEVGRIAATAFNAELYMKSLVKVHGSVTIDYIEDETSVMISRMVR